MSLIVPNLSIEGFRSFKKLEIGPFGRVNLITGKNNSGKSTLLEAIRILVTEGSLDTFYSILNYREEFDQKADEALATFNPQDISAFCSLFSGYPKLSKCTEPFTIRTQRTSQAPELSISVSLGFFIEKTEGKTVFPYEEKLPDKFRDNVPGIEINVSGRKEIISIEKAKISRAHRSLMESDKEAPGCIYLDPFSTKTTERLSAMWDRLALTDAEDDVVRALQIIAPDIRAVSMVGGNGLSYSRTAIARSSQYDHPVPLRSFGDGVNRLFGLILSLVSGRGGVLLVDEIENGFHYSVLPDVWRVVFKVAADLNIQVFATTHSWDCIDAFQKAASEHPEEGVLARLTVKDDRVIPTIFREEDLRIITEDRIEVR